MVPFSFLRKMSSIVHIVLHFLLSILTPCANLLVITVICQLRKKKPSRNYVFILNLAAADLLVGVMCIGEALDEAIDATFDKQRTLCLLRISMSITPCIASILTLLLVSLDRYLAVKLPLYYPTLMSKQRIVFSLVVLWILAFVVGHIPLISPTLQKSSSMDNCDLLSVAKNDYLYIICFGIFIPALLILVALHVSVGKIAYLQQKRIRHSCLPAGSLSVHLHHFKALRTVLLVIICFTLSWGPYYVVAFVKATCSSCSLSPALINYLFLLGETNSLINPFIYSLHSKDIRAQLARLMECKRKDQIKPWRPNGQVLPHFNIRTQSNVIPGECARQDAPGDLSFPSLPYNSSPECRTVFSIS